MDIDDIPLADLRPRLIAAMLPNVPFDGWTPLARDTAADAQGIDRDIAAMALPDAAAMADAYTARADAMMTDAMLAAGAATMKVRDRIKFALRTRLEHAGEDREAVRAAKRPLRSDSMVTFPCAPASPPCQPVPCVAVAVF